MALISTIGAGIYTTLKYGTDSTLPTAATTLTGEVEITDIRDFPTFGTPANIVNVPQYGQAQSSQVGGQADAPTLEFTLNYKPSVHGVASTGIQSLAGNNVVYTFEIAVKNAATGDDAIFYVQGTIASFTVTPSLTDSNTATLTLATQGSYAGPFAS